MRDKGVLFDRVAFHAELPTEAIPGMPLVEIVGCRRVLVENHKGISMYGCKEIHVNVSYGQLCICGEGLELARMTNKQLVITGKIDSISICRR